MSRPRRPHPGSFEPDTVPIPAVDRQARTVDAQPWYLAYRRPSPPQPPRTPAAPPPPVRPPVLLLIATGVAVLGLLSVILLLGLGRRALSGGTELDVRYAQAGVAQVLTDPIDGYGRDDVANVRCNGGRNPKVEKGNSFSCVVDVGGVTRQVIAVFADDAGTYEVDRPR